MLVKYPIFVRAAPH